MAAENGRNGGESSVSKTMDRKSNSHGRAGVFSKLWFLWMMPLFRKGMKKDLSTHDLSRPLEEDLSEPVTNKLEINWMKELQRAHTAGRKPSLLRALVATFISSYILDGVLILIQNALCRSFQPILLAYLIMYFTAGSGVSREEAYMYAGGVVLLSVLNVFINHHTTLRQQQLGMRLRIACCSLVYRKILRLNCTSLGQTTAGQLVNLMSNDVNRFDMVLLSLHYLWIMPINVILICYLLYTRVGLAAIIGVASICIQTIPVQSYMGKLTSNLRKKIAVRTDERVRLMNEIISGIQVIKMYAWEKPFEQVVATARAHEVSAITSASYLRGIYMSFMVFTERASLYVTLLAFSLLGNPVTSAIVFSLAQFYNSLQALIAIVYPTAVSTAAECAVTVKRLEQFLMMEEREDLSPKFHAGQITKRPEKSESIDLPSYGEHRAKDVDGKGITNLGYNGTPEVSEYSVDIRGVTASWAGTAPTLANVSLRVPKGKLCAVIGSVGSGKSSLLQLLLNELSPTSGSVKIQGSLSYSSQEPWLFVATVRNNILFGQPYDAKKYREVVRVCALEKDFQQFPRGDQTLVGERGVSLSGGQRARINLARAVYREADVYLLDDPLSAVDAHVGRHLFQQCISRYLSTKTTILVTHQLHYLRTADIIVILNNGHVDSIGTYDELASTGKDFAQLLATLQESKESQQDEKGPATKVPRRVSQVSTTSVGNKSEFGEDEDEEVEEAEEQLTGGMRKGVYWKYWRKGGSLLFVSSMAVVMLLGQLSASLSDYWVTYWTNQQSLKEEREVQGHPALMKYIASSNTSSTTDLYPDYTDATLIPENHTFYVAYVPSQNTTTSQFDIFETIGHLNTAEYLYVYTAIIISCVILTISRSLLFFKVCMNASKGLHDQMFNKLLRGIMRFFDTNPSGRILNRFSKDIGAVDELLPKSSIEALQIMLVMVSILVLVSITNLWMMLPVAVVLLLFYAIFSMYLATAQDIKRLEGITRSPVFSHVTASLNGISTIRASGASQRLAHEFDIHQDLHTSTWYQYISCSATLGFWLDIVCCIFLTIVSFSFIFFDAGSVLSGNVGLAISQSLILTGMLQYGVRQIAEIVSQMTSVERVLQYTKIEAEKNLEKGNQPTPDRWPNAGGIRFQRVNLKYNENDAPVLKDLNFNIHPGWKVGIVGRTGAGKSSLISALFRLAKVEGLIEIDGVDTRSIALQDLRSRISIIPQEPVLFQSTVRYNLDPFNKYDDASLWTALEAVELKEAVTSLDQLVSEGGGNFSLGQRQLVCLARAILRNNKILVLDEATANVDPQTDAFIQKTIREKFSSCTVLTIAHRLNTVMDSDRVIVMAAGYVAEMDSPAALLSKPTSMLSSMARETGKDMAQRLRQAAGVTKQVNDDVADESAVKKDEEFDERL